MCYYDKLTMFKQNHIGVFLTDLPSVGFGFYK